ALRPVDRCRRGSLCRGGPVAGVPSRLRPAGGCADAGARRCAAAGRAAARQPGHAHADRGGLGAPPDRRARARTAPAARRGRGRGVAGRRCAGCRRTGRGPLRRPGRTGGEESGPGQACRREAGAAAGQGTEGRCWGQGAVDTRGQGPGRARRAQGGAQAQRDRAAGAGQRALQLHPDPGRAASTRAAPDRLAAEAVRFQQKLAAGLQTLREVGDYDYGATGKEEVWRDGKVVLYRYAGAKAPTAKVPVLISYALVNRPYMVDLQENRSLVRGLLERGEDVYIIDWGYPDRSDRFLTLEDYIERFLGGAVDELRRRHRLDAINLLGICQGGAFALTYAALHPEKIRNLITMVTPV